MSTSKRCYKATNIIFLTLIVLCCVVFTLQYSVASAATTVAAKNLEFTYDPHYTNSLGFRGEVDIVWDDIGIEWYFAIRDMASEDGAFLAIDRDIGRATYEPGKCIVRWVGITEGHTYEFFIYPKGDRYDSPTSCRFVQSFPLTSVPAVTTAPVVSSDSTSSTAPYITIFDILLLATPILYLVFNFTVRKHANDDMGVFKRVLSTIACAVIWDVLAYFFAAEHPIILGIAFFVMPFCEGILADGVAGGIEGWRRAG